MKIKKLLSFAMAITMSLCSFNSAFAAEGDKYVMGDAIDITTGQVVTEYTAGQKIAVPVDFVVEGNAIYDYRVEMTFDDSVLSWGLSYADLTDDEYAYIQSLGGDQYNLNDTNYETILVIDALGSWFRGSWRGDGTLTVSNTTGDRAGGNWYTGAQYGVSTEDGPELYFCFEVKKAISSDELNIKLYEPLLNNAMSTVNSDIDIDASVNKVNACYGAFKVDVDNQALIDNKTYISAIKANIYADDTKAQLLGSYDLTEYVTDDEVIYSFPTRITSNGQSVTKAYVEIVGTISDADGNAIGGEQTFASKTISLDSTVTSYE